MGRAGWREERGIEITDGKGRGGGDFERRWRRENVFKSQIQNSWEGRIVRQVWKERR